MGYLICEECGGHYKLKEGESPEDFVCCPCGGKLKYLESLEEPSNIPKPVNKLSSKINEIIIDINTKIKRIMTFSSIYNKFNKPESSLGVSWSQNRKIAVSSVFFMVIIFIGIGGLMFKNT